MTDNIGMGIINSRGIAIKLSIVIPVFNKWNFTKACLEDLFQLPIDHEIVLVDNASSDETQEECKKLNRPNFKYIRNTENFGFAKACNIGYTASNGNNILFLNNDIRVKSDFTNWTKALLDAIEPNALIGPTAGYVNPENNFSFVHETNNSDDKINYMSGWCLAASRETFNKLDMDLSRDYNPLSKAIADKFVPHQEIFSEEFGIAYFEDTDLSFRAEKMGMKFKLVEVPVHHFGKMTSKQLDTAKLYSEARKIFINKWGSK